MDKIDVFLWVEGDDGAGAAVAARSLRQKMKAETADWFLLGPKTERAERLAYDLGMRALTRPERLGDLGALVRTNGTAPLVLLWSGAAVLAAEWTPLQGGNLRLWDVCPGALLARSDVPASGVEGWPGFQAASKLSKTTLPANQVKVVGPGDFEKAIHGSSWPFGPTLVILEQPVPRR